MAAKAKDEEDEVEDELDEGQEGAAAKPKRSLLSFLKLPSFKLPSLKMMIIGAAGLLVVAGGAGGAYFYFFNTKKRQNRPPSPRYSSICPTCWSISRTSPPNARNISK